MDPILNADSPVGGLDCPGRRDFDCQTIGIRIERSAAKQPALVGELLELSLRRAKVALDSAVPSQEPITLRLENHGANSGLAAGARIGSLRAGDEGSWIVNCVFNHPLPALALRDFFGGDIAERRKHFRYPIVGDAAIDWELGRRNVPVKLLDLSEGGFRLLAVAPAAVEARLHLVLRLPGRRRFVIPAVTRWTIEDADGFAVGCEFLHNQGTHLMRAILPAIDSADHADGKLILSRILHKLSRLPLINRLS